MMRLCVSIIVLLAATVTTLASPLPRDTPFFIAFLSLFFFSFRHTLVIAFGAGALADLFSPIPGVLAISYPAGIYIASLIQRHLLTNRSLIAFLLLGLVSGLSVMLLSLTITGIVLAQQNGLADTAALIASRVNSFVRAGMIDVLFLVVVYYWCRVKPAGRWV